MEENLEVSTRSVGIKWGVINGLLAIVMLIVVDFAGLVGNSAVQWVGLPIAILLYYLAHKEYKDQGDGFMSYGQGVGIAFWTALIGSLINSVFTFIYISFINTNFTEIIKEQQVMEMEKQGMTDAQIDQALQFSAWFTSPTGIAVMGVVMGIIMGLIIALIVTAVTKNTKPELV